MLEGRVVLPADEDARELLLPERVLEQELDRRATDTPAQVAVRLLHMLANLLGVHAIGAGELDAREEQLDGQREHVDERRAQLLRLVAVARHGAAVVDHNLGAGELRVPLAETLGKGVPSDGYGGRGGGLGGWCSGRGGLGGRGDLFDIEIAVRSGWDGRLARVGRLSDLDSARASIQ